MCILQCHPDPSRTIRYGTFSSAARSGSQSTVRQTVCHFLTHPSAQLPLRSCQLPLGAPKSSSAAAPTPDAFAAQGPRAVWLRTARLPLRGKASGSKLNPSAAVKVSNANATAPGPATAVADVLPLREGRELNDFPLGCFTLGWERDETCSIVYTEPRGEDEETVWLLDRIECIEEVEVEGRESSVVDNVSTTSRTAHVPFRPSADELDVALDRRRRSSCAWPSDN